MDNRITDKIMGEEDKFKSIRERALVKEVTGYFRKGNYHRRLWEARKRGLIKRFMRYSGWEDKI